MKTFDAFFHILGNSILQHNKYYNFFHYGCILNQDV